MTGKICLLLKVNLKYYFFLKTKTLRIVQFQKINI